MRKLISLSAAAVLGAAALVAVPAQARADSFSIQLGAPPPPVVRYYEPAPRGHWVPGHWERRHGRNVWFEGYWTRGYPTYAYATPRWDRDGDGVPNRYDRAPDNPYRR